MTAMPTQQALEQAAREAWPDASTDMRWVYMHHRVRQNDAPFVALARRIEAQQRAPQDHWTCKGAIDAYRAIRKAADSLCVAAQTTGGAAGRDDGLCAAIDAYAAERKKYNQMVRIIELEGDEPEIGAGILHPEAQQVQAGEG